MAIPVAAPLGDRPGRDSPLASVAAGACTGAVASPLGAFEEVYEAHFDFVWRSVRRLGVPPASVDDAVQDVFVECVKAVA